MENRNVTEEAKEQFIEDYQDKEGYLCCGKCHTRKEMEIILPFLDGTGESSHRRVGVLCKCESERIEQEKEEIALREHQQTVKRLQSVCFKSQAKTKQTFELATKLPVEILEKAQSFVENWEEMKRENTGLLFWGDVGTGKSYTAACIANALMEQEVPVLMRNMGDFMSGDFEEREELCRSIASYGLVILDDLGMERGTEYGLETAFRVIDARCESRRPTIITTNLTLQDLKNPKDLMHQRIYDRVLEMCTPICFSGESVREDIHKNKKNILQRIFRGGR